MRGQIWILATWLLGGSCAYAQPADNAPPLRIATWNTTWLGHPDYPPVDDAAQVANAITILRAVPADVWALQEIAAPEAFEALVDGLGPGYSGILAHASGDLRLGLVYRADEVRPEWVSEAPLDGSESDFADRPPLFVQLRLMTSEESLLLVVVHLKAYADQESAERRLRAVEALKATLDSEGPQRVILAGDFNDGVDISISARRDSPLRSFRLDFPRYIIPTARLEEQGENTYCATATCSEGGTFDHFILTTSLLPWEPAVRRADEVLDLLPGFVASTSDHLPIVLTLSPPITTEAQASGGIKLKAAYPNPSSEEITIRYSTSAPNAIFELVDVLGRVQTRATNRAIGDDLWMRLEPRGLPAGVYVLRARTATASDVLRVVRLR